VAPSFGNELSISCVNPKIESSLKPYFVDNDSSKLDLSLLNELLLAPSLFFDETLTHVKLPEMGHPSSKFLSI